VALDKIGQDEELSAKLNVFTDAYSATVIKAAKDQYVEYNYDSIISAEGILNNALTLIPDNADLQSELAFYKEHEPIRLIDLETDPSLVYNVSTYSFGQVGSASDVSGVPYEYAIAPVDWYENSHPAGWSPTYSYAHFSWLLDYQYSKITGVFFFSGNYSSASVEVTLSVAPSSGSERTWTITNTSGAKIFEVDLSGSKSVELSLRQDEIDGTFAYLADVYVWR